MDDSQGNHNYDMILVHDIFSELQTDLYLSNKTIRVHGGMFEGCTAPMKIIYEYYVISISS